MQKNRRRFAFWIDNETDYFAFLNIVDDPQEIAPSYAAWAARFNERFNAFNQRRVGIVKVRADPHEFAEWCKVNSQRPDSRARQIFAAIKGSEGAQGHAAEN